MARKYVNQRHEANKEASKRLDAIISKTPVAPRSQNTQYLLGTKTLSDGSSATMLNAEAFLLSDGSYSMKKLNYAASVYGKQGKVILTNTPDKQDYFVDNQGLQKYTEPKPILAEPEKANRKPPSISAPAKKTSAKNIEGAPKTKKPGMSESQLKQNAIAQRNLQMDILRERLRSGELSRKDEAKVRKTILRLKDENVKEKNTADFKTALGKATKEIFSQAKSEAVPKSAPKTVPERPSRIDLKSGRSKKKLNTIRNQLLRKVDPNPKTHRGAVKSLFDKQYNARIRTAFTHLTNQQKLSLIQGRKESAGIKKGFVEKASDAATHKVDAITTGAVSFNKNWDRSKKRVYGTVSYKLDHQGLPIDRKRIQPIKKGKVPKWTMPLSKSQTTKVDKAGRRVVVYTSAERKAHREGKEKRQEQRRRQREVKLEAKRRQEAANKASHGSKLPIKKQRSEKRRQREFRKTMNSSARIKKNAGYRTAARKILTQLKKPTNTRTLGQLLDQHRITSTQFDIGRNLPKSGRKKLNIVMNSSARKRLRKPRSLRGVSTYPPMRHASGGNRRGRLVTTSMMKKVSGRMTIAQPRQAGLYMGGQNLGEHGHSLYGTKPTISVPKKDFGMHNRGIMMALPLRGRILVDVSRVLANLTRAENAVRAGIIASSDAIGKKMLDIIEPYVPKDDGYMYQSARTNVDQAAAGKINFATGVPLSQGEMYGVTISYNTPYAEMVYFDQTKAHGAEYNAKHGVQAKGQRETARWIEVAMQQEHTQFRGLLGIWAQYIRAALNKTLGGAGKHPNVSR